jgi:hypothetical protein
MTNIWDPLLVMLALGLIGVAWSKRDGTPWLWLSAGLVTGLNAYFFTSSRLLPIILLGLAVQALLLHRRELRERRRHIVSAAGLALVVALPQVSYYLENPNIFMERANALGILDIQSGWLSQEAQRTGQSPMEVVGRQFLDAALAFNYSLDSSPAYRPLAPLLGFGVAILFAYGLRLAVLRFRLISHAILLTWLCVTVVFAGALLVEVPSSHRLLIAAPAISLLAAIALADLGQKMVRLVAPNKREGRRKAARDFLLPALVAIAALLSFSDILFYFGQYRLQHSFGDRNTEIADRVSDYLNSIDGDWTAYFYGPPSMYIGFPTFPFLVSDFQAGLNFHDVFDANSELMPPTKTNMVHIYLPERADELETTRAAHPEGDLRTFHGFFASPLFYAYEVRSY